MIQTRRRLLLSGLGASLAWPSRLAHTQPRPGIPRSRVSLADLGARPGTGDAAPFFAEALARLPRGGAVLHVPPGVWRFARTDGVAVKVEGFEDLAIEGDGARLIFNGRARPFVFSGCRTPAVRGLAIDWERAPFSQGEVVGAAGPAADIRIDPEFPVDGSEEVAALGTYDRGTGLVARGGIDAYGAVESVALIGNQRLRLALKRPLRLRPGDTVVLRHAIYAASAFSFIRCADVLVEDVTIHGAPGMGVYADRCTGACVRRLRITPPPGSTRLMTTTADGAHFSACSGRIIVEDCLMGGMGDDCVNVHGKYFEIARRLDARTVVVAASPGELAGPRHAAPVGGKMGAVAAGTFETLGEGAVAAAEPNGDGTTTLRLDRDLPPGVGVGDYVFDVEFRSQASVSCCRFPGNRARGVLAHNDAVIEGCTFSGQSAEAVLLLPDARFMEGPAVQRVTVRGNEVADALRLGGRSGAIRIDAAPGGARPAVRAAPLPVNRDVAVVGNRIADGGAAAVLARATDNLLIAANCFERPIGPAVVLGGVRNVRVVDNICAPASSVAMGPLDRPQVVLEGNVGLSEA